MHVCMCTSKRLYAGSFLTSAWCALLQDLPWALYVSCAPATSACMLLVGFLWSGRSPTATAAAQPVALFAAASCSLGCAALCCAAPGAHCIDCGRACSVYAVQQAVFDDEVACCDSCGGLVKPGESGQWWQLVHTHLVVPPVWRAQQQGRYWVQIACP